MQPNSLGAGRLATMAIFALSCFGLLLFLWNSFGGAVPLKPKGYRVEIAFPEAATLAEQAEVRVSGVAIGEVVALDRSQARTRATLEIRPRFAPLRRDVRATLRFKTLLGETFVELTPGSRLAPFVPEGGRIPDAAVAPTTEIDELLATFDPPTRKAVRAWLTGFSAAVRDRSLDLQGTLAGIGPLARDGGEVLERLRSQDRALRALVRSGGTVFRTVGRRQREVRRLVTSSERVFATTAARSADLRATLRGIPPFLRALRPGLGELEGVVREADPVLRALEPSTPLLGPTLREVVRTAPEIDRALNELGDLGEVAPGPLRALRRTVRAAVPLLDGLYPLARDLIPAAQYVSLYRTELTTNWPAIAAGSQFATQRPGQPPLHYFRAVLPVSDENFVVAARRSGMSRPNPYPRPRWLERLAAGLEAFDCRHTDTSRAVPVMTGSPPPCLTRTPPLFQGRRRSFQRLERAGP